MRFVSVSFLFLGKDLICRFRRPLATAHANRFALRLARNSARRGTLSRSPAFMPIGLWSYFFVLQTRPFRDKNVTRRDAKILRTEATAYLSSAKGAVSC